jgi:hypothetical protein
MSVNKLKQKFDKLQTITPETVESIMKSTYKATTPLTLKKDFPQLNFYCSWAFQSSTTDNTACYYFLEQVTDIIKSGATEIEPKIFALLNSNKLRSELIEFYRRLDISTHLFGDCCWGDFYPQLLLSLCDKKIILPNNLKQLKTTAAKEIYNKLETIATTTDGLACRKFWLSKNNNPLAMFAYHIELFKPETTISGKLLLAHT